MVNFSSNNQAYITTDITKKINNPKLKNELSAKHVFQCRNTKRKYYYWQYCDKEDEIFLFTPGEIYVLYGLINVSGYNMFLILRSFAIDEKSKQSLTERLYGSGSEAENSIKVSINDNS